MYLKDYLTELSYKELSNLALSDNGSGTIKPDRIPFVVSCINEALLRLYSKFMKFMLKERRLIVEPRKSLTQYNLNPASAYSTTLSINKYIVDGDHPFTDDLIKVLEVSDRYGRNIPLNNASNSMSVFTPRPDVLQVPNPSLYGGLLSLIYQARHPVLNFEQNPNQEIELPDTLMGALSAYVAYSVYNCINTEEATNAAQKYMQMYVALIQETTETDTMNTSISQDNSRFLKNGWC